MEGEGSSDEGAEGSGAEGRDGGLRWKEKFERSAAARTGAGCIWARSTRAVKI